MLISKFFQYFAIRSMGGHQTGDQLVAS